MSVITDVERIIMRQIRADPKAAALLEHKCRWEGMTTFGVLREFGDPRHWPAYREAEPECFRCHHPIGAHDEKECRGGEDLPCRCDSYEEPEAD